MPKQVPSVPSAPDPIGPYSVATEAAGLVFVSGQVGAVPATGSPAGPDVASQTRQVMENLGAILEDLGLDFDDVVKTTIYLADMADFATVNSIYGDYVSGEPPSRATIQAAGLPAGYLVEIELVAAR